MKKNKERLNPGTFTKKRLKCLYQSHRSEARNLSMRYEITLSTDIAEKIPVKEMEYRKATCP